MKFLEDLLFLISVPKCVGCGERLARGERALCQSCKAEYDNIISRNCSLCSKVLSECSCTNKHLDSHYVHKLIKIFRYVIKENLPTNNLIFSLKRENRSDVSDFLAEELAKAISNSVKNPEKYVFTAVPRSRASILKYGIDHAEIVAKKTAKIFGAKYMRILKSKSKHEQKKSRTKESRVENAKFELINEKTELSGSSVILIDDIVTTGASMGNAAMLLKAAGAGKIIGAAISIAYKDNYEPFDGLPRFRTTI